MATILRKIIQLASNRPCLGLDHSRRRQGPAGSSSLGAFDEVPEDVLLQILRLLGPKDVAKMSLVCRSWKSLASDDRLWIFFLQQQAESWESISFAETHLRLGYPIQTLSNAIPELSFMSIYSKRAQVPVSVIIDGGSGYCKFGWSKHDRPLATSLKFGYIESPMHSKLRDFFSTIYGRMQVKASSHPIVVSIPLIHYYDTESAEASRRQLKEAIYSILFEMNVPAVCAVNQATLALYAARRISGIAINIGFRETLVVPILNGKVMRKARVEVTGIGASVLTHVLRKLHNNTRASCEVAGEGWFTLSKERFQTGEILFQPRLAGVRTMGLHQAVALCMEHCDDLKLSPDDSWFKTVVISGESSRLPGLAERLERELHGLLPPSIANGIRVIPPPYGVNTAWFGAKQISNLSTFPGQWCVTRKQFQEKSRFDPVW